MFDFLSKSYQSISGTLHSSAAFRIYTHCHALAMSTPAPKSGDDCHYVTVQVLGQTVHVTRHNLSLALHHVIMFAGVVFIWTQIVAPELEATTASQAPLVLFSSYSVLVALNACLSVHGAPR